MIGKSTETQANGREGATLPSSRPFAWISVDSGVFLFYPFSFGKVFCQNGPQIDEISSKRARRFLKMPKKSAFFQANGREESIFYKENQFSF